MWVAYRVVGVMSEPQFRCKTHDSPVYGYAHITEHKALTAGRCEIVEPAREVDHDDIPEESRFDITNDPRSA